MMSVLEDTSSTKSGVVPHDSGDTTVLRYLYISRQVLLQGSTVCFSGRNKTKLSDEKRDDVVLTGLLEFLAL
jgi:hypothetical protein